MCEKYMVLLKVCGQIILVYWETWVKYMFIYNNYDTYIDKEKQNYYKLRLQ